MPSRTDSAYSRDLHHGRPGPRGPLDSRRKGDPLKAIATAALSLLLISCGGSHHSNPTAPQSQLAASVILNTFSAGSVLAVSVSFDGQEIGRSDWSTVGGCIGTCLVQGAQNGFPSPGPHVVTVTILNQSVSVIDYSVQGTLFLEAPDGSGTIPLELQSIKLKVGGTVTYNVTV